MAVPAHDTRDFAFAKKYDLEIRESISPHLASPKAKGIKNEASSLPLGEIE